MIHVFHFLIYIDICTSLLAELQSQAEVHDHCSCLWRKKILFLEDWIIYNDIIYLDHSHWNKPNFLVFCYLFADNSIGNTRKYAYFEIMNFALKKKLLTFSVSYWNDLSHRWAKILHIWGDIRESCSKWWNLVCESWVIYRLKRCWWIICETCRVFLSILLIVDGSCETIIHCIILCRASKFAYLIRH